MPAVTLALAVEQGALWSQRLEWREPAASGQAPESGDPIDLTGWHARMQVRRRADADDIIAELRDTAGYAGTITLGGAAGTIDLELDASVTAAISASTYRYDLELVPPSGEDDVVRLVEGPFTVSAEVTR